MGKLIAVGVVVAAVLVYGLRPHGASAAKVGRCLEREGATVSQSRFFEDLLGTAIGAPLPEELRKKLHDLDEHVFDVAIGSDTGWLMDTKRAHEAGRMQAAAVENGFDLTAQGRGKVVMLWSGGPSAASRAALDGCL